MGELMSWLWSCVCWIGNILAVPFCYLLAALTIVGVIMLVLCLEAEMRKDNTKRAADEQ